MKKTITLIITLMMTLGLFASDTMKINIGNNQITVTKHSTVIVDSVVFYTYITKANTECITVQSMKDSTIYYPVWIGTLTTEIRDSKQVRITKSGKKFYLTLSSKGSPYCSYYKI